MNRSAAALRKIHALLSDMSLVRKLIAAYVLVIALPLIGLGIFYFNSMAANQTRETIRAGRYEVDDAALQIHRDLEICMRSVQQVVSDEDFLQFLSEKREHTTEEWVAFKSGPLKAADRILELNPDLYRLRFFSDNPYISDVWMCLYNERHIADEPWRQQVLDKKGSDWWRMSHREEQLQGSFVELQDVVSLYRDVFYLENKHVGIIEATMLTRDFFPNIAGDTASENSFFLFLRSDGYVYFNPANKYLSKSGLDPENLRETIAGKLGAQSGDFSFQQGRDSFLVIYSPIRELDGWIAKIISVRELTNGLSSARNGVIAGVVVGIALLSLVTWLITSAVLKKLGVVIGSMRRVQNGDLGIRLPSLGSDEIGELAGHFDRMMARIQSLLKESVQKEAATKDAEIRALQTQINAHFIYNVLEAVKTEAELDGRFAIADHLTAIGRMLRYGLNWSSSHVSLGDEINHIRNYLMLMNLRCENRITVDIDIPRELLACEVLKMSIQPVVENAVVHGLCPRAWTGTISISAAAEDEVLNVYVRDNGAGIPQARLGTLQAHLETMDEKDVSESGSIGLKNVSNRLKLFFGENYGLAVDSREFVFTLVRIRFPLHPLSGGLDA